MQIYFILHAVRLERRSCVTRIVAPAELPRLGVPSLLIYRSRRVGVAARAARRSVGVLTWVAVVGAPLRTPRYGRDGVACTYGSLQGVWYLYNQKVWRFAQEFHFWKGRKPPKKCVWFIIGLFRALLYCRSAKFWFWFIRSMFTSPKVGKLEKSKWGLAGFDVGFWCYKGRWRRFGIPPGLDFSRLCR